MLSEASFTKLSHPYTTAAVSLIWERRKFLFTSSNPCQGRQWCLSAWLHCTFPFPPLFPLFLSSLEQSDRLCLKVGRSRAGRICKCRSEFKENKLKNQQKKPKAIVPTSLVFLNFYLPFSGKSWFLLLSYFMTPARACLCL